MAFFRKNILKMFPDSSQSQLTRVVDQLCLAIKPRQSKAISIFEHQMFVFGSCCKCSAWPQITLLERLPDELSVIRLGAESWRCWLKRVKELQDIPTLFMFLLLNSCEFYILIWRLVPGLFSNLVKRSLCDLKKYIFPNYLLYNVHVNAYPLNNKNLNKACCPCILTWKWWFSFSAVTHTSFEL